MQNIKQLYSESYLAYLIATFKDKFLPEFKQAFLNSFLWEICLWFKNVVFPSKVFLFIFDANYMAALWYKSYFYRSMTYRIRKVSFYIPKASIKYHCIFIGVFLGIVLLLPEVFFTNFMWIPLLAALLVLFISRNIRGRIGTVMILVNIVIVIFMFMVLLAIPYSAAAQLNYLLLGIDLFFLISYSIKNLVELEKVLKIVFIAAAVLCTVGFIQNQAFESAASAVFKDGVVFGEILVLVFPFVMMYPYGFKSKIRKNLYYAFIFITFFNVVLATQSKAAFIGFMIEIAIFAATNLKYAPLFVLLMPLGLSSITENFRRTFETSTQYGNVATNISNALIQFWNYGFGVNGKTLMGYYDSNSFSRSVIPATHISALYFNILIDIGAVFMFFFLLYLLRVAHSSFTLYFIGNKKYKKYFAAGFAMLVGISVSAMFESALLSPRILLIYWAMLGILRSIRIMSFGIYEP